MGLSRRKFLGRCIGLAGVVTGVSSVNMPSKIAISEEAPKVIFPESKTDINLEDYIFLPNHNLYVAKQKALYKKNWYQTHKELNKEGARMLTIRELVDFLILLQSNDVEDGLENKLTESEVALIRNEILEQRDPWRAERLDAKFSLSNDQLYINYNHRMVDDKLEPQNTELLEDCLMEDKRISLDYWLKNATNQGLPPSNTPDGDLWYWHPSNNTVVGFDALAIGADLSCSRAPQNSSVAFGVRRAREK